MCWTVTTFLHRLNILSFFSFLVTAVAQYDDGRSLIG
jgi:hypothetical protein